MRLVVWFLAAAVSMAASGYASEGSPPLGLWVWSADAPDPKVELTVQKSGGDWLAIVDGKAAPVTAEDGSVIVEAPGERRFVGKVAEDGSALHGLWHQPPTRTAYAHVVTPITLSARRGGRWSASFQQQARPFRVFLDVFENEEGSLVAVIRNPERNEIMTPSFAVEPDGEDRWTLVGGRSDRPIRQTLRREGETLVLDHSWFAEPLTMRPTTASEAVGYLPEDPSNQRGRYAPPPALDDGWTVASAEEAGFDAERLGAMVAELSSTDPRDRRPRLIHAVLAAHKGRLVVEEYFYGYDRETTHDTRSLGKVFAPTLIGALQQEGKAIDADVRPIPPLLEEAGAELGDPRKATIDLGHLMTFTSGLDCDENGASAGSEDRMWEQEAESNFWLFTARLPLLHEPGERYAYCSGSINLVGSSIASAGGKPIIELFDELIADPLSFGPYHWNLTPNGTAYLGGGPYMRPRDILKIGVMFAQDGKWNGEQVIDPAWTREATEAKIAISPETTGMTEEEFSNTYFGGRQAYEWRIDEVRAGERIYPSYEATGNGGQVLVVVPELDLVVLFMGGNYRQGGVWGRWRNQVVGGHIIPAMTKGE